MTDLACRMLFEASPGLYLVLAPDRALTILGLDRACDRDAAAGHDGRAEVRRATTGWDVRGAVVVRVEDVTDLALARREGVALEARIATEQRRADLRFRDLVDLAPDGVIVCDPAGTILLVNIAAERMFGFTRAELVGHSLARLLPARARALHTEHMAQFVAAPWIRPMCSGLELAGLRCDGREFPRRSSRSSSRRPRGTRSPSPRARLTTMMPS